MIRRGKPAGSSTTAGPRHAREMRGSILHPGARPGPAALRLQGGPRPGSSGDHRDSAAYKRESDPLKEAASDHPRTWSSRLEGGNFLLSVDPGGTDSRLEARCRRWSQTPRPLAGLQPQARGARSLPGVKSLPSSLRACRGPGVVITRGLAAGSHQQSSSATRRAMARLAVEPTPQERVESSSFPARAGGRTSVVAVIGWCSPASE